MPGKRGGVTLKELQAKAKAAKVKGWSKMSKAALMQRVGGGGGGAAKGSPTKKRPVTTAKRYEATKVAGAIADKLAKKTGVSDPVAKEAIQHRLLTSVKKAVTQARKTPGATDQDVRKAAAQAVKTEVMAIRGATEKKKSKSKSPKAETTESKKKSSTRKSSTTTPPNDEAKRRARKTGKEVSVVRNLDYNPGAGKRDIHKATLTGSAEKGGRESRRPPKREKASGSQGFDDLAGAFGSTPTSKQKSSKTTTGTPQKQKRSPSKKLTGEEKKARLARVNRTVEKMEQRRDRLAQETEKARQSYDHDRYEKLKSRMDTLKQRRRKVKNLQSRLAGETAWI